MSHREIYSGPDFSGISQQKLDELCTAANQRACRPMRGMLPERPPSVNLEPHSSKKPAQAQLEVIMGVLLGEELLHAV